MIDCAWLKQMSVVVVLTVMMSACTSVRQVEEPAGPSIRVLSWNVNWGMPGAQEAARTIREADADIVSLQETNEDWELLLRSKLTDLYPHILVSHDRGAGGQMVLSKHPLQKDRVFVPAAGWFPVVVYRVVTPIGKVRLAGVHLRPPVSDKGSWVSGYLITGSIRLSELEELHRYLAQNSEPTIILGDFNDNDSGAGPRFLRANGYTDALREFDRRTDTWRWNWRGIPLRDRLDHIFYSADLHSPGTWVMKKGKSDHYPIVCVLERKH